MGTVTNIDDAYANVRRWIREGTGFVRGKLYAQSVGTNEVVDPGTLNETWGKVLQSVPVDYLVTWDGLPVAWHWREKPWGATMVQDLWAIPYVRPGDVPGHIVRAVREALVFAEPITRLDDYRLA